SYLLGSSTDFKGVVDESAVSRGRNLPGVQDRLAHVDGGADHVSVGDLKRNGLEPRVGLDDKRVFAGYAAFVGNPGNAADTVTAHVAAAPIRVVHLHPNIGGARRSKHDKSVAADSEMPVREPFRERWRIGGTCLERNDVYVVVAAAMHLGELERCHSVRYRLRSSTIFSLRMMSSKLSRSRIT